MPIMKTPLLRPTGKGQSFFSFISNYWLAKNSNNRAFHRLCTLMRKMGSQRVFVEELLPNDSEIDDERAAIEKHFGQKLDVSAFRFTFLSKEIPKIDGVKSLDNDDFLASAVLLNIKKPDNIWHSYLQKAIVCQPKLANTTLLNNYIHVYKDFDCSLNINDGDTHSFKINGTFFCQQNSITSVCAHASLSMIINNMDLPGIGLISTEWINKAIGIDHITKKVDVNKGLNETEVMQVVEKAGLKAIWFNFFNDPNSDYAEYIYRYIEGRSPTLLVFSTHHPTMHVVPVIGHTLNSDIWRAEAEIAYNTAVPLHYQPSSAWVDHFIIHDDNFGMYLSLPVDSLRRITLPKYDPAFRAYLAIIIVPEDIPTPAREAEWAAALATRKLIDSLRSGGLTLDIWLERLADQRAPMAVRTLLMTKENYKNHLNSEEDFEGKKFKPNEIAQLIKNLPERFWLSEVTLPDLYTANKSKLIDFIYVCTEKPAVTEEEIFKRFLQIRLPGACIFGGSLGNPIPLTVQSHYPLYRDKRDVEILEW